MSLPPSAGRQKETRRKVLFRDQAIKGAEIADVYIVESYAGEEDEEERGTLACSCVIF